MYRIPMSGQARAPFGTTLGWRQASVIVIGWNSICCHLHCTCIPVDHYLYTHLPAYLPIDTLTHPSLPSACHLACIYLPIPCTYFTCLPSDLQVTLCTIATFLFQESRAHSTSAAQVQTYRLLNTRTPHASLFMCIMSHILCVFDVIYDLI